MRVLYFHQHFSTRKGAIGTRSFEMAKRLIARGHTVHVICGSYSLGNTGLSGDFKKGVRRGSVEGIQVTEFDLQYSNKDSFLQRTVTFLRFALRSVVIALREPCDVLFATSTPLTAALPGICARWWRRTPFVFEIRDLWPELPRAMGVITNPLVLFLMRILEWLGYHSATRLIGLAPGIIEGIAQRGIPASRIALIPNGCDNSVLVPPSSRWRPAGVADGDLLAIFSGAHGIANGLDAVLDAGLVLKARHRADIKILLIGDGKLKSQLQERARREGIDSILFHDPVDKERLGGLLAAADLGLQILANVPAFYQGTSPNKFFDYIAAGLPVLINYPGWLAEIVTATQSGFATAPSDAAALADALEEAADNREQLRSMGQRAQRLARERFDRDALGEQFVSWLEGAVRC